MKEFEQKDVVQFIDLPKEVDEFERSKATSTAQNIFEKIKRISKAETTLLIHVKRHEVEGARQKYSVHARVNWPRHFYEASHFEWDFLNATQVTLQALLEEVKRRHSKEAQKKDQHKKNQEHSP